MKTSELRLDVIFRCECGKVNRGPVLVYKGEAARHRFLMQFIFEPVDRLVEASAAMRQAVTDVDRLLARAELKTMFSLEQFALLRKEVLQSLPPQAAKEAQVESFTNCHLYREPDWDKIRVLVTPVVACLCDILVPKLKVGVTEQIYTCHCPECDEINDWQEPPGNPVTCPHCGEQFHLDCTLLYPS